MTTVARSGSIDLASFEETFRDGIDLQDLDLAGLSEEQRKALAAADLDHNGVLYGVDEMGAAFKAVDKNDTDGKGWSFKESGAAGAMYHALLGSMCAPSLARQDFEVAISEALRTGKFDTAADLLNGMNMEDMLKALEGVDPNTRANLVASAHAKGVNAERIQYAVDVVTNRILPAPPPGDLKETGQVKAACDYVAGKLLSTAQQTNPDARRHISLILMAANEHGIIDPGEIAYILATAHHESHFGRTMVEEYSDQECEAKYYGDLKQRHSLGNTEPGDGAKFKGRGYVQLTGRANYEKYREYALEKYGVDIVADPGEVSRNPELAAYILVDGMQRGSFTGKKKGTLDSCHRADGNFDLSKARGLINGDYDRVTSQGDTFGQRVDAAYYSFKALLVPPAHLFLGQRM